MKAILKEGILCIDSDGDTIILDTGSPVSLGNGSTLDLDGVSIKTQLSILGHDWQAIEESVPFSVKALVGTDQIGSKSLCINLEKQSAIWAEPLIQWIAIGNDGGCSGHFSNTKWKTWSIFLRYWCFNLLCD